jgi:hypothetical protein
MSDDEVLSAVADAIAAGGPIDWAAAESSVSDATSRELVRQLKTVSAIAALYRELPQPSEQQDSREAPVKPSVPADMAVVSGPNASVSTWGALTLVEQIGHGSFGDTWRARDARLDREVALKLLRRHGWQSETVESAVIDEGRLLARVRHPNVVTVWGRPRRWSGRALDGTGARPDAQTDPAQSPSQRPMSRPAMGRPIPSPRRARMLRERPSTLWQSTTSSRQH